MFPLLFALGPVKLYTSTVFLLIAVFVGLYIFWKKGKEEHYLEDELVDAFIISVFWGIVASRVSFIVLHFDAFGLFPLRWLDVFTHSGFTPIFGMFASASSLYRFAQKQKWDEFELLDFGALALSMMMAILWLGNFFAGAELGSPTNLPFGVTFPNVFDRRHPLQLYGTLLYLLLFAYLSWVESRYRMFSWYRARKDSAQTGFLYAMFCISSGVFGILLWLLSSTRVFIFGVPLDLVLRGGLILYGLVVLLQRSGRSLNFRRKK